MTNVERLPVGFIGETILLMDSSLAEVSKGSSGSSSLFSSFDGEMLTSRTFMLPFGVVSNLTCTFILLFFLSSSSLQCCCVTEEDDADDELTCIAILISLEVLNVAEVPLCQGPVADTCIDYESFF